MFAHIKRCFAVIALFLMPITACAEDDLYAKIKDTENFKNADAVFVGEVIKVRGRGPTMHENGSPGPVIYFAEIAIEKSYKGSSSNKAVVAIQYPYLKIKVSGFSPLFQQGRKYIVFGKLVRVSHQENFSDLSIQSYYATSEGAGTKEINNL